MSDYCSHVVIVMKKGSLLATLTDLEAVGYIAVLSSLLHTGPYQCILILFFHVELPWLRKLFVGTVQTEMVLPGYLFLATSPDI